MGKILFVDNERLIREGIAELIDWQRLSGEKLKLAENASDALLCLEQEYYEIVITDIYMQDINGIELAKQIKTKWPYIKVILLSAYEDFEYAKEAIEAGVFKYLLKPVIPEELEEAVKDALKQVQDNLEYKNQVLRTEKLINDYRAEMEKNFWKDVAYGNMQDQMVIEERSRQLGMNVENSGICCVVLEDEDFSKLYCVSAEAEEIASACFSDYLNTIFINRQMIVLLRKEPSQKELFGFWDKLPQFIRESVRIAVGNYVGELLKLPFSIESAGYKIRERNSNTSMETDCMVSKAVKIIKEEIQNSDFNINTIAQRLHVTSAYFSRVFRKRMGVTCIEYIQNYRVDLAKELLSFTNLSNQEISERVGYTSVYYFNQQFKKITGETPGAYRRKRQSKHV